MERKATTRHKTHTKTMAVGRIASVLPPLVLTYHIKWFDHGMVTRCTPGPEVCMTIDMETEFCCYSRSTDTQSSRLRPSILCAITTIITSTQVELQLVLMSGWQGKSVIGLPRFFLHDKVSYCMGSGDERSMGTSLSTSIINSGWCSFGEYTVEVRSQLIRMIEPRQRRPPASEGPHVLHAWARERRMTPNVTQAGTVALPSDFSSFTCMVPRP